MKRLLLALSITGALLADDLPPRNAHENLDAVLWMQTSIEYSAITREIYHSARQMLDRARKDKKWTAAIEQTGNYRSLPPAIILDLDETAVDNSRFYAQAIGKNVGFEPSEWPNWVNQSLAGAIPGAVEFTKYAASKGVAVFYVSNRDHSLKDATRRNLASLGFPLSEKEDRILLSGDKEGWASDKTSRRQEIAQHYRILLLFGDDLGDFLPGARTTADERLQRVAAYQQYWGIKWIVLPNPVYGSWESALYPPGQRLNDREALRAKYQALRK